MHLSFLPDDLRHAHELARHVLVQADDVVEELADAAEDAVLRVFEADVEIALLHGLQDLEQVLDLVATVGRKAVPLSHGDGAADRVHHRRLYGRERRRAGRSAAMAASVSIAVSLASATRSVLLRLRSA